MSDQVPKHYQGRDGRNCADYILDALDPEGMCDFWRGNAMKYLFRAGRKGGSADYVRDICKAADCLQHLLALCAADPDYDEAGGQAGWAKQPLPGGEL